MGTITDTTEDSLEAVSNNWPYTMSTGLDPYVGTPDDVKDLESRLNGVTFEHIAKNIASYPYEVLYISESIKEKTFFIDGTKKITLRTELSMMSTFFKIVQTITGDTGYDTPLVKTKVHVPNKVTHAVYS